MQLRLKSLCTVMENGCWLFRGRQTYQRVRVGKGRKVYAHRASWEAFVGPIPEGVLVLHKCDVGGCINPDHLWLGSQADNMADMDAKRRGVSNAPSGKKHYMADKNHPFWKNFVYGTDRYVPRKYR